MSVATPALVHRFALGIDGADLGSFTECSGLAATFDIKDLREGGENGFLHKLWGPISYANVTLARAVDEHSAAVAEWVTSFQDDFEPSGGHITALDPAGETIVAWNLREIVPISWTGPQWSASGSNVAKETLVIAHGGFTVEG